MSKRLTTEAKVTTNVVTSMTTSTECSIVSNYTEIRIVPTLAEAKRYALAESSRFDDAVIIEQNGASKYLARHGELFRLVPAGRR